MIVKCNVTRDNKSFRNSNIADKDNIPHIAEVKKRSLSNSAVVPPQGELVDILDSDDEGNRSKKSEVPIKRFPTFIQGFKCLFIWRYLIGSDYENIKIWRTLLLGSLIAEIHLQHLVLPSLSV